MSSHDELVLALIEEFFTQWDPLPEDTRARWHTTGALDPCTANCIQLWAIDRSLYAHRHGTTTEHSAMRTQRDQILEWLSRQPTSQ
ncbi:hypothetical protein ACFXGI_37080 [Streptomyces sp. NPDC059355]|uniref:hypothetical protein n=1 Tax=Streptomyces sp. NPDC059355 TaxID=3346811 RepID=UPI0036837745